MTHHLEEIVPDIAWFVFLKKGQLIDEGERRELLTDDKISSLFDIDIRLNEDNGRLMVSVC